MLADVFGGLGLRNSLMPWWQERCKVVSLWPLMMQHSLWALGPCRSSRCL